MRIGIDATGLYGPRTGIENYITNITNCLLEIDKDNHYTIYCRNKIPIELGGRPRNAVFKSLKLLNRKIFQQTRLPALCYFDKIDVMFFPGNTFSYFCPCRSVLTIHDIFPFVIADYMPKYNHNESVAFINSFYWKWMSKVGCSKADKVIAVSNSTKNDLMRIFSVGSDKVSVIYEAAAESFSKVDDEEVLRDFRERYRLKDEFILCVGTGTYKNLQGSIKAFFQIKKKNSSSLKLLITGPKGRIREDVFKLITESNYEKEIILWDYFPEKDLNLLYSAAEFLLFPSFYEGFGLPVLEAFACGTPVITSNVASLPEIAGDAAMLVDPYNPEEIAFHLERVLNDKDLKENMALKGFNQTTKFTWINAAKETLKILEQVGAE